MKSIILYFQFFTAIPIRVEIDNIHKNFRKGIVLFPIYAALYSLLIVLFFVLMDSLILNNLNLSWLLTIIFDFLISRGMHFDALSDMADGMLSSREQKKILQIMKDSNIGVMGVFSLMAYFMIIYKFPLTINHGFLSHYEFYSFVFKLKFISRVAMTSLFYKFRYPAGLGGLGDLLIGINGKSLIFIQIINGLVMIVISGFQGLMSVIFLLTSLYFYRKWIISKIGGQNGDTVGAAVLIAEILFCIFTVFLRRG